MDQPTIMLLAMTRIRIVALAAANVRQSRAESRATGINTPSCGLTEARPKRVPLKTGRAAARRKPPTINAAERKPVYPNASVMIVAGANTLKKVAVQATCLHRVAIK